jgi:hypothetical protein
MVQVFSLYKSADAVDDPRAEYYCLIISTKETFQSAPVTVRESHGWWDAAKKEAVLPVPTFEEEFDSLKDAEREFERHVWHRASEGFIHCFSRPVTWEQPIHRLLKAE